jgi:hypothetical protein
MSSRLKKRNPFLLIAPALLLTTTVATLPGCAGSVIFGHVVGEQPAPAASEQPAPAVSEQPTPAASEQPTPAVSNQPTQAPPKSNLGDLKFGAPTVISTPDANASINADPRFNRDALATAIATELGARRLTVESGGAAADRSIEVTIEQFSNQLATNAVILGHELSNAALTGTVKVCDRDGRELRRFEVEARYRLATSADHPAAESLAPLFRRFAQRTVDELTGVPIKTETPEMPR